MLQFGAGSISVSGKAIARLNNISVNITYDTALLRGGTRVFSDYIATYNGNVEGSFENGEIDISAIGSILGADIAASALTLTATQAIETGLNIVVSCTTNGITAVFTLYNCRFPGITFNVDRENFNMPTTNFVAAGQASDGKIFTLDTT